MLNLILQSGRPPPALNFSYCTENSLPSKAENILVLHTCTKSLEIIITETQGSPTHLKVGQVTQTSNGLFQSTSLVRFILSCKKICRLIHQTGCVVGRLHLKRNICTAADSWHQKLFEVVMTKDSDVLKNKQLQRRPSPTKINTDTK
jgi:hypothetical protein